MRVTSRSMVGLAVGTSMAVGLLFGTVEPAQAAIGHVNYWSAHGGSLRGTGFFSDDPSDYNGGTPGDAVQACDWLADGYGIEAQIDVDPGDTFHADRVATTAGHPSGADGYCTAWKTGNIREGAYVALRVCKVKTGTRSCGRSELFGA